MNRILKVIALILIALSLPISVFLVKQNQDNRSSAAAPDQLEAEGGVLSATGVSRQTDTNASGGNYVEFTNPTGSLRPPDETSITFITPPPISPLPAFNVWQPDSMFPNNRVKRITSNANDDFVMRNTGGGGFNSDGSIVGLGDFNTDFWLYLNTSNWTNLAGSPDRRYGWWWDHSNPKLMYFSVSGGNYISVKDITKPYSDPTHVTTLKTFTNMSEGGMGSYSGQSWDDKYFPYFGHRTDGKTVAFGWNRTTDTKTPDIETVPSPASGGGSYLYMSPWGRYMIVIYDTQSAVRDASLQRLVVYAGPANTDFAPGTLMPYGAAWSAQGKSGPTGLISTYGGHKSFGLDTNGEEVVVSVGGLGNGPHSGGSGPAMVRLRDGWVTYIAPTVGNSFNITGHNSGESPLYPGWMLFGESDDRATKNGYVGNNQLVSIRLTPATTNGGNASTPTFKRWCYGQVGNYAGQANDPNPPWNQYLMARTNFDHTKVIFTSAWRQGPTAAAHTFICEVAPTP